MASVMDEMGVTDYREFEEFQRNGESTPGAMQLLPVPTLETVTAQLAVSRHKNERQAAELAEQAETIGQLRSEVETAATEVIGLKIAEHRLMKSLTEQAQEMESLRAKVLAAQAIPGTAVPLIDADRPSEGSTPGTESGPDLPWRWWALIAMLAVAAALAAWVVASAYRW